MRPIAVLGSCTLDIIFRMARVPTPGETLIADDVGVFSGGKGLNQAIAARRLGHESMVIGRVGADTFADQLLATLRADRVDIRFITRDPEVGTGIAVPVVVPGGQNFILAAPRANLAMTLADIEAAKDAISGAGALLLQFETPMNVNLAAVAMARAAGVPVILNPAPVLPAPPGLIPAADILVVNEVEAEMLAGPGEPLAQAAALQALGPPLVVVTLGPGGLVARNRAEALAVPAFAVMAHDTVGAGDAFCGALGAAVVEGMPFAEALRFASAAAALSVTRAGAAPSYPTRTEVEGLLAAQA